jgi:hypothetical protein
MVRRGCRLGSILAANTGRAGPRPLRRLPWGRGWMRLSARCGACLLRAAVPADPAPGLLSYLVGCGSSVSASLMASLLVRSSGVDAVGADQVVGCRRLPEHVGAGVHRRGLASAADAVLDHDGGLSSLLVAACQRRIELRSFAVVGGCCWSIPRCGPEGRCPLGERGRQPTGNPLLP